MTLTVTNLVRHFGDRPALRGVSLEVAHGEIHGFVGVNGAGKSTTLRIVAGLLGKHGGEVTWDARTVDQRQQRRFGYMPEQRGLYPKMHVGDQLEYFARLRGVSRGAARENAAHWLRRLGLGDAGRRQLQALSHGNQQRVQLAACLVGEPELLLLDEPFSGLDVIGVSLLSEILRELADSGAAVLFSSHQLDVVERLCARVTIIDRGRTLSAQTVQELRSSASLAAELLVDTRSCKWDGQVPGVTVHHEPGGQVRLSIPGHVNAQAVLDLALKQGRVVRFEPQKLDLTELLTTVVSGRNPASERGVLG
jgi:ABC-2 type transport system ATP-binding protein